MFFGSWFFAGGWLEGAGFIFHRWQIAGRAGFVMGCAVFIWGYLHLLMGTFFDCNIAGQFFARQNIRIFNKFTVQVIGVTRTVVFYTEKVF